MTWGHGGRSSRRAGPEEMVPPVGMVAALCPGASHVLSRCSFQPPVGRCCCQHFTWEGKQVESGRWLYKWGVGKPEKDVVIEHKWPWSESSTPGGG